MDPPPVRLAPSRGPRGHFRACAITKFSWIPAGLDWTGLNALFHILFSRAVFAAAPVRMDQTKHASLLNQPTVWCSNVSKRKQLSDHETIYAPLNYVARFRHRSIVWQSCQSVFFNYL